MKKNYPLALTAFALCFGLSIDAQTRYVDDITQDVSITNNVQYGENIGIITQAPAQESLNMAKNKSKRS